MSCCDTQTQMTTTQGELDQYNATISISLWSNDESANDTASEMADDIMEAIRGAVETHEDRDGIGINVTISETQSMFQPRKKQISVELHREVLTGDLEESPFTDPRQMQFPFE